MSLTPKQQAVVNWAKAQLDFFERSNDVKSYTHYNDIEQTLDMLEFEGVINSGESIQLSVAFQEFYSVLKDL